MSNDPDSFEPADDLQFTTAEPGSATPTGGPLYTAMCAACGRPITSTYYAVRDKMICPVCRAAVDAPPPGSRVVRLLKAGLMGLCAGLVGAVIWFAVRRGLHLQIGLVAVLVGFMVGKSVRRGSGGRGGRRYQVMAVLLTYFCISANYVPDVIEAVIDKASQDHQLVAASAATTQSTTQPAGATDVDRRPTTAAATSGAKPHKKVTLIGAIIAVIVGVALVFGIAMAAPFLSAAQNPIGLLIIGFALWEAWKFNAPRSLAISGPYQVGGAPPRTLPGVRR